MAGYPAKSVAGTTLLFSIPLEEYQVYRGRPSSGEENQVGKSRVRKVIRKKKGWEIMGNYIVNTSA